MLYRGCPLDRLRPSGRSAAELILLAGAASICSAPAHAQSAENPFAAFSGEWTLKDDKFQFVGDGKNVQTQIIPNHHTRCDRVNTDRSVLCVVKAGDLNGHILWTFDALRRRVHWLSHFGTERTGYGTGTFEAPMVVNLPCLTRASIRSTWKNRQPSRSAAIMPARSAAFSALYWFEAASLPS